MRLHVSLLRACAAVAHIDCARAGTHCVSICMDSCRFICTVGHSADLCMDMYGDLVVF